MNMEQKTKEQQIDKIFFDLEKDLSNFEFTIERNDKTIEQYVKLLKLTKAEYQKLQLGNKKLKEKIENIGKN